MITSYHGSVTETEIIDYVSDLSGVVSLTASAEGGAPAAAWGDTFFFDDPEGNLPENQRLPFATVVIHDYAGWDTESGLDRDGIFRSISRSVEVASSGRRGTRRRPKLLIVTFDYEATDELLPHPLYASQGWVSILNRGDQTSAQLRDLLDEAYGLAAGRYARRQGV